MILFPRAGFKSLWDIRQLFAYTKEILGWFAKEILLANNYAIQFGVLNLDTRWFRKPKQEDHDYGQAI